VALGAKGRGTSGPADGRFWAVSAAAVETAGADVAFFGAALGPAAFFFAVFFPAAFFFVAFFPVFFFAVFFFAAFFLPAFFRPAFFLAAFFFAVFFFPAFLRSAFLRDAFFFAVFLLAVFLRAARPASGAERLRALFLRAAMSNLPSSERADTRPDRSLRAILGALQIDGQRRTSRNRVSRESRMPRPICRSAGRRRSVVDREPAG
jgi:hypothetical protein